MTASPPDRAVLVVNAGSSSIKFALFACPTAVVAGASRALPRTAFASGEVTGIGEAPQMRFSGDAAGRPLTLPNTDPYRAALAPILAWLQQDHAGVEIVAAAHRVVHGGTLHAAPVIVDDRVLDQLRTLIPLAPLHQPHTLDAIDWMRRALPGVPQVAVFDTAFHRTLPRCEQLLPLPHEWFDHGVRRYGFHGLSYEYLSIVLAESFGQAAYGRVVLAHLGSGASLCALDDLRSVATTMGFSALDGLMMGTRSGALDPGVVLHLLEAGGLSHRELGRLLYEDAGLKGVSGRSADLRDLLAREAHDERARDAVALYVHQIVRQLGSLVALLGGLDMLVFTAGVGEHSAPLRRRVCAAFHWLGVDLDGAANDENRHVISTEASRVHVVVEPTNEEWIAAHHALPLLALDGTH